jgi:hypothetical protein
MFSAVLSVEVLMPSAVLFFEPTVQAAVLAPGHRLGVCCPMLSPEFLVLCLVFGAKLLMTCLMLGSECLVLSLVPVISKDSRCRPQQSSKGKNGQGSFL